MAIKRRASPPVTLTVLLVAIYGLAFLAMLVTSTTSAQAVRFEPSVFINRCFDFVLDVTSLVVGFAIMNHWWYFYLSDRDQRAALKDILRALSLVRDSLTALRQLATPDTVIGDESRLNSEFETASLRLRWRSDVLRDAIGRLGMSVAQHAEWEASRDSLDDLHQQVDRLAGRVSHRLDLSEEVLEDLDRVESMLHECVATIWEP